MQSFKQNCKEIFFTALFKKMENTEIHKELVLIIEQLVASTNPEKKNRTQDSIVNTRNSR